MNRIISTRTIIALLACLMVGWAFTAVPLVHKHQPTQQVPLQDYDASCCFLKSGKIYSGNASQYALVSVYMLSLLLFFITLQPLFGRLAQEDVPVRIIFTRKATPPRAPPA
jgi:hypothetical protein